VTDAESTPITGIGELATNDGDDGTLRRLNDAVLVISGDRVAWTGPASRAPAADRAGRTDLTTPLDPVESHIH
jgi:imidazolonepropionase